MTQASTPFGPNTQAIQPIIRALEARSVRYPTAEFFCLLHSKLTAAINPTVGNKAESRDYIWGTPGVYRSPAQVKSSSERGIKPDLIHGEMSLLVDQLASREWRTGNFTPVHKAAFLIARFHAIAPFGDGNARVSSLTAGSMLIADHQGPFMFKFAAPKSVPQAITTAVEKNDLGPLSSLIHMSLRPSETRPGGKIISPYRVNPIDAREALNASRLPPTTLPPPPPGEGFYSKPDSQIPMRKDGECI